MPTENRRVAAYLPKSIDDRLETFKVERGLKGDSPALIAILEEYFGVSREVTHSSNSLFDIEAFRGSLLSELRSELLDLRLEIKNELLSELRSELPKADEEEVDRPKQLSISVEHGHEEDEELEIDELPGELKSELPTQPSESDESKASELPDELESKPLDGSVTWSGVELGKRLRISQSQLASQQHKPKEQFAEWSQEKDPNRLRWQRLGRGKYVPILDTSEDF